MYPTIIHSSIMQFLGTKLNISCQPYIATKVMDHLQIILYGSTYGPIERPNTLNGPNYRLYG